MCVCLCSGTAHGPTCDPRSRPPVQSCVRGNQSSHSHTPPHHFWKREATTEQRRHGGTRPQRCCRFSGSCSTNHLHQLGSTPTIGARDGGGHLPCWDGASQVSTSSHRLCVITSLFPDSAPALSFTLGILPAPSRRDGERSRG